jgi:hypothetical protein
MEANATYSAAGINATYSANNSPTYLDMDIFMGAKAEVGLELQFNATTGDVIEPKKLPAQLTGGTFVPFNGPIAANTFTLNGHALPALNTTGSLSLNDVVSWLNSESASTGVTASAVNNQLVLARPANDLTQDIRLGMGAAGAPTDLKKLGFDTRIAIKGGTLDDLLVFVTDRSGAASTAQVTAQFADIQGDMKQALRRSPMTVTFTSNTDYTIVDTQGEGFSYHPEKLSMERTEDAAFGPGDRIGQLTMRNLDIQDTRTKLDLYRKQGQIEGGQFELT